MTSTATGYKLLAPESVARYLDSRPSLSGLLDTGSGLEVREVGDGNLNLIFIVRDQVGASLVLKQALPYVRMTGPSWPLTPERTTAEARVLEVHGRLAPNLVPKFYDFSHEQHVLAMEDLSSFQVWRNALNNGERHPGAADAMGRYVARVAFGTSLFGVEAKELKARLAEAVNPALCEITEDLVFTEPYIAEERDWFQPELAGEVASLRADEAFLTAIGEMKYAFMTEAEALIHGDLHTGSVMVRPDGQARAFDCEFGFYGPVGFDLSCLFGNYLFALARARVRCDDDLSRFVRGLPGETWNGFATEMRTLWPDRIDPRVLSDAYLESWLQKVHRDAIGMTAAELCRRTIGLAHVSDIESLPERERAVAVRALLRLARKLAPEREKVASVGELVDMADDLIGLAL
ncbi:MAG: S-methyl-5-thioribose kinase [Acidimicrobiales bacterium]|jgi:5-methylthioribose kinase